ncbi:hypothetical protein ABEW34_17855 [Paenibacillus algorifonticola]|uniref:hypothetical protein n=1 Tax=Paenibacillus algorifonticola TaxID=684063 RepID=UPI003D2A96DD
MEPYILDNGGIFSLSGFSYQIRVFVYYMLKMKEGMQIEFETIEDVNMKKIKPYQIDEYDEKIINKIVSSATNEAIQVKRTKITESTTMQILMNWFLLETSEQNVSKYTLFTDSEYGNLDILFSKSAETIFEVVKNSKKTSKATITKVKKKIKEIDEFIKVYESIKQKYEYISANNIDTLIDENCSEIFRKAGVNKVVYYQRIKELLQHVTVQVIESIHNKNPYIFSYQKFIALVEEICNRLTEEVTLPQYSDFKKLYTINFNDLSISKSREYKQLLACELPEHQIKTHLGYGEYYKELRFRFMELNKIGKINDLEETTYENYEMVKMKLQNNNNDTPFNRLDETKQRGNTYAETEPVRFGSGIFLTKAGNDELQISWKDEEK